MLSMTEAEIAAGIMVAQAMLSAYCLLGLFKHKFELLARGAQNGQLLG
jgi:hypothetical protein